MRKELTSDVPRIKDGLPGPLDEKHDSPGAVIRIKQSDPNMLLRGEFNIGGCVQRDRALIGVSGDFL